MDRSAAARLALQWSNLINDRNHPWAEGERTGRHRDAAHQAVWNQLREAVPDSDRAVVYMAEEREPAIAVLADGALYVVCVVGFEGERALAECRLVSLDPERARVTVTSQHWSDSYESVTGSDWRFEIDDATISIRTTTSSDEDVGKDELFCRALAAELGWRYPERMPTA
jgi:hypothetical protein